MNKLKLNYTSLSFLPILVCIPLGYQLINNIHFGGFKLFQEFLISAFNPKIDNEIIITVIKRLNETILIGFFSWLVSIIFGAIFGIISSNIFYKIFNIPNFFYRIIRFFLTIIKNLLLENVDKNNTKKSPKTTLVALHRLDLLNDFDKVIGIRDGKIFFNIKRNNLKKLHLDKIY